MNLKRYINACGKRFWNYANLFQDCTSMKSKELKLISILEDMGIEGRPTLKKCEKIRKRRERERERKESVVDIDMGNVITGRTRKQRKQIDSTNPPTSTRACKKYTFGGLDDCIESDDETNNTYDGETNDTHDGDHEEKKLTDKKNIFISSSEDESNDMEDNKSDEDSKRDCKNIDDDNQDDIDGEDSKDIEDNKDKENESESGE